MYQPGDVLLLPFPFSDRNSAKKRPILLLKSADSLGDFICLAVTSVPDHSDGFLLRATDFVDGSLPRESWVRTEKAYTLNMNKNFRNIVGAKVCIQSRSSAGSKRLWPGRQC